MCENREALCCRICTRLAEPHTLKPLFDSDQKEVLQQIVELTGLVLPNEKNLPENICKQCLLAVKKAYRFRESCISAQEYFNTRRCDTEFIKFETPMEIIYADESKKSCTTILLSEIETNCEKERSQTDTSKFKDILDESSLDVKDIHLYAPINNVEAILTKPTTAQNSIVQSNSLEPVSKNDSEILNCEEIIRNENSSCHLYMSDVEISSQISSESENSSSDSNYSVKLKNIVRKSKNKKSKNKSYCQERIKKLLCDLCGRKLCSRQLLEEHLRRHAGDKTHQCENCSSKFISKADLRRHNRVHTGERPYACRHCDRKFTEYSSRFKHERTHTNDKPFVCSHCPKAFTTSYLLKNHLLVHSGERNFICAICNKFFKRQSHLSTHYRSLFHKQNEQSHQLKAADPNLSDSKDLKL